MQSTAVQQAFEKLTDPATLRKVSVGAHGRLFSDPVMVGVAGSVLACAAAAVATLIDALAKGATQALVNPEDVVAETVGRGIDPTTASSAISLLVRRGVFIRRGEQIAISHVDEEIDLLAQDIERRSQAWEKRRSANEKPAAAERRTPAKSKVTTAPVAAPAEAPATPIAAEVPVVAPVTAPVAAPVAAPLAVERPTQKPSTSSVRRLSAGTLEANDTVLAVMPTDDGKDFEIMKSFADSVASSYPQINVEEQILRAGAWCRANPGKRKTPRGMPRFINSWLNAAQREAENRQAMASKTPKAVRNGFGMGAVTEVAQVVTPVAAPVVSHEAATDEFADLELPAADESFDAPEAEMAMGDSSTANAALSAPAGDALAADEEDLNEMLSELGDAFDAPDEAPARLVGDEIDAFCSQPSSFAPELDDAFAGDSLDSFDGAFGPEFGQANSNGNSIPSLYGRGFVTREAMRFGSVH